MNGKTIRIMLFVLLIATGYAGYAVGATPEGKKSSARAEMCDVQPARQSPSTSPKTVNMALLGLGLVAIGAVTRRRAIKHP